MARDDRWHDLSPLFDDDEDDEIGIGVAHGRRSSSYYRLADPLLRLTVLKLDGSSFDIQVQRTASVRGLKVAVESVFTQPEDEDEISWSHVWSNFCLNYRGENLIDDGVSLRSLRVKDGDKLHFVKHHLSNYSTIKSLPSNKGILPVILPVKRHRRAMTAPDVLIKYEGNNMYTSCSTSEYVDEKGHNYEEDVLVERKEFKLVQFFLRWFSCTGVHGSGRTQVRTP